MKKLLITLLVAIMVFTGTYVFFTNYLDVLDASNFREDIDGVELGEGNVIEQLVANELLFLFAGVDALQDPESGVRTDTLILMKVDTNTGKIAMVSIPRDTQVLVDGNWDKINHAHAYGGMTMTLKTIRDWLGIDLDYYVKLDFAAVEEIVDAMGGVYVDIPFEIYHPSHNIDLKPGRQLINGNEAIYYARYRKQYEDGDIGRIGAQQQLLVEIIKQALSVSNIPKLGSFVKTYINRVDTNIPMGKILEMIPMAGSINTESIETYLIPGEAGYEYDISYYFYHEEPTKALVDKLFLDYKLYDLDPTTYEIEEVEPMAEPYNTGQSYDYAEPSGPAEPYTMDQGYEVDEAYGGEESYGTNQAYTNEEPYVSEELIDIEETFESQEPYIGE